MDNPYGCTGNVDEPSLLRGLLQALAAISQETPLVFPVHPRTRAKISEAGLDSLLHQSRRVTLDR